MDAYNMCRLDDSIRHHYCYDFSVLYQYLTVTRGLQPHPDAPEFVSTNYSQTSRIPVGSVRVQ